jgi:Asp/Glu/hydantoin racemase
MARKILLINPNITQAVTDLMTTEARLSAREDTEIHPETARFGAEYIENRAEAAIAGHAVLDVLARNAGQYDAAIVAAFGDPGLSGAKEMMEIPVVGIAESAFLTAHALGRRYSILAVTKRLGTWFGECAEEHGLAGRLAAVRALDVPVSHISNARAETERLLVDLCHRTIEEDGAEVVIMGGGPIAGLAREVAHEIPVPVLDGVSCAVRMAEMLIDLGPAKARIGSQARPPAKPTRGLSEELARYMERRD